LGVIGQIGSLQLLHQQLWRSRFSEARE